MFSLGRWSSRFQAGFHVSDPTQENATTLITTLTDGTITLYGGPFQDPLANRNKYCRNLQIAESVSYNTPGTTAVTCCVPEVWAVPISLATTLGIAVAFFSLVTEMFHFARSLFPCGIIRHNSDRVSPFGNLRVKAYLAARRSLSQLVASFIEIWCQGIHSMHL